MNKLLVLFPLLFAISACNFNVTAVAPTTTAPTAISQSDSNRIPPEATFTFTPEVPQDQPQDAIVTGRLSYPSEFIPPMRVVLFSLTDGKAYFVDTAKNQGTYSLDVPVGTYYIVSYLHEGTPGTTGIADSYTLSGESFAGGYTHSVPCGLSVDCTDHGLIPVTVEAGQTASADPGDWYAPEGTFPPMPNP
jgi:hypothetical protein